MSATLLVLLLGSPAVSPSTATPPPESRRTRAERRLDLGPHLGRPGLPVEALTSTAPHFSAEIEVWGRAPRDLDATMADWWQHWKMPAPAIYGQGIAFRQGGVDVLPLIEWAAKKIKNKRKD